MKNFLFLFLTILFTIKSFSQCENDTINPWFINFQNEPTISCSDDLLSVFPIAADNCDTLVEIPYVEEIFDGDCPGNRTILRLYRAFDDSGNGVLATQIIHIVDETPPTFLFTPSDLILGCDEVVNHGEPIILDNCGSYTITYNTILNDNPTSCFYQSTRIWSAIDECGNQDSRVQTITLVDTVPPTIIGDVYIVVNSDQPIDTPLVTVTDNCSTPILTYTDNEVSGGNIIRIYTATDECNNTSTFEQIINIDIVNPPGDDEDGEDDDDDEDDEDDSNKVAICHCTGNGNCHTIYVAQQAVQAHLNHGNYLGPCTEIIMDWQTVFPNSDLQMTVIKGKDNKYKKFVKVK
jgi:hypothetical protein